jgi:hypothetical protein
MSRSLVSGGDLVEVRTVVDDRSEVSSVRRYRLRSGERADLSSLNINDPATWEEAVGAAEFWTRGKTAAGQPFVAAPPAAADMPWYVGLLYDNITVVLATVAGGDAKSVGRLLNSVQPLSPAVATKEQDVLQQSIAAQPEVDRTVVDAVEIRLVANETLSTQYACIIKDAASPWCVPLDGFATFGHIIIGSEWLVVVAYPLDGGQPLVTTKPDLTMSAADGKSYRFQTYRAEPETTTVNVCVEVTGLTPQCTDLDRRTAIHI